MRRIFLVLSILVAVSGSAAQLTYSVTPPAVAYTQSAQSIVTLKIVAVNRASGSIPAPAIQIHLPVGCSPGNLVSGSDISLIAATAPKGWTIQSDGFGSFRAMPPPMKIRQGDSFTFTFSGIVVNSSPGLAAIEIDEGNPPRPTRVFVSKVARVAGGTLVTIIPWATR